MIHVAGAPLVFRGAFTSSKLLKTGLTVTVDIYAPDGTQVVTNGSTSAVGPIYQYTLAAASVTQTGLYTAVFKTTDTTVDLQQVPGQWAPGRGGDLHRLSNLDLLLSDYLDQPLSVLELAIITAVADVLKKIDSTIDGQPGGFTGEPGESILDAFRALMRPDVAAPAAIGGDFDPVAHSAPALLDAINDIEPGGGGPVGPVTVGGYSAGQSPADLIDVATPAEFVTALKADAEWDALMDAIKLPLTINYPPSYPGIGSIVYNGATYPAQFSSAQKLTVIQAPSAP